MTEPSPLLGRLDPARSSYLQALRERVVVFDGAAGTCFQALGLGADAFGGHQLEGCYEILNLSAPSLVEQLHRSFLDVGVDAIETNTFGAFSVVLAEYGVAERATEINRAAAELARRVADEYRAPDRPIWVAGSMGPGTKFATLGQISYAELRDAYEEQARGLLAGGVDLLLVETVYDLLGAKAAINGARAAMASLGLQVPIQVQVTIELTGRMLPGTEIAAALTTLAAMQVDVVGLNCATGPAEMGEALRHLSANATVPIACQPNAGLPSVVDGAMHYDLQPDQLAEHHYRFITELGVSAVGGCCGTTPAHLAAVVERCAKATPAPRRPDPEPAAASIYSATPFRQEISFLVVGERANANGSRQFREAMLSGDWDTCVAIARDQVKEGSHLIDVCVDYTGADGVADMEALASRLATQSSVPIMVDTTEGAVAETALRWLGGRPVLNSVNLEDGDGPGTRLDTFLRLARTYGAAVVCTCIDAEGQARTAAWKLRAAKQIAAIATERYGLAPEDLFFDPLALPLSTGMEESRRDGIETIEGIRQIKAELPRRSTGPQLGVPARVRRGRTRRRHRARVEDPSAGPDRRASSGGVPGPHLRPPPPRVRPPPGAPVDVRGCLGRRRAARRAPGLAGGAAARAADRRWEPQRPGSRPGRGARTGVHGARDHQRLPLGRDAHGRGPLRFGRDAAAVRPVLGRDHEGRRGLPRATHGEDRPGRKGHHRSRHREGRRARHRQEPGRHHPHQQRVRRDQPRDQGRHRRDDRGRRRARC